MSGNAFSDLDVSVVQKLNDMFEVSADIEAFEKRVDAFFSTNFPTVEFKHQDMSAANKKKICEVFMKNVFTSHSHSHRFLDQAVHKAFVGRHEGNDRDRLQVFRAVHKLHVF
jgi:hypothetical protein